MKDKVDSDSVRVHYFTVLLLPTCFLQHFCESARFG